MRRRGLTDESGLRGEVPDGNRDLLDDVLTHHLDVVLELGRDGNDGRSLSHRACGEGQQHSSMLGTLEASRPDC